MEVELPYRWIPRTYQVPLWKYMEGPEPGKRACCIWHRRAGKDLTAMNITGPKMFERVGTYWHMLPTYKQGRNIVWNGHTRDGRKFLDHFPKELIQGMNATEMRITFKNGSIWQVVGTDNINSLVGTNPVGVVFSEYSLHDPAAWEYIRPILAENGGWAMFIYTPRGKNHGYQLREMARKDSIKVTDARWFFSELKAGSGPDCTKRQDGTPVISDEIIDQERADGMPEEMIAQEFFVSFEAPLIGAYYGAQMRMLEVAHPPRIGTIPWDPKLPVHTAWDLGVGDSTAIWFIQRYGLEHRAIDYYENSGEGLPHYVKVLRERPYVYDKHYAPHDIEVREFTSGKARIEVARELGLRFTVVPKHSVEDGIEAVRNILPSFFIDENKCARGLAGLREYKKEWNEDKKIFNSNPDHNWASHPADAFRMYAWGVRTKEKRRKLPQERAEDNFDYLNGREVQDG